MMFGRVTYPETDSGGNQSILLRGAVESNSSLKISRITHKSKPQRCSSRFRRGNQSGFSSFDLFNNFSSFLKLCRLLHGLQTSLILDFSDFLSGRDTGSDCVRTGIEIVRTFGSEATVSPFDRVIVDRVRNKSILVDFKVST